MSLIPLNITPTSVADFSVFHDFWCVAPYQYMHLPSETGAGIENPYNLFFGAINPAN
jgi:hypothetical protein